MQTKTFRGWVDKEICLVLTYSEWVNIIRSDFQKCNSFPELLMKTRVLNQKLL